MIDGISTEIRPLGQDVVKVNDTFKEKQNRLKDILNKVTRRFKRPGVEEVSEELKSSSGDSQIQPEQENDGSSPQATEVEDDEFIRAMNEHRAQKTDIIQTERRREMFERAFNKKFTTINDIETAYNNGDEQVSRRQIEVEGKKIFVYDLHGFPLCCLTHAIDYKHNNRGGEVDFKVGREMSRLLQEDPSIWDEPKIKNLKYGGDGEYYKSDAISTSYINLAVNPRSLFIKKELIYGFDHVEPGSIRLISPGDGFAGNRIGNSYELEIQGNVDSPEFLETKTNNSYNEVQIRRFDELGQSKKPDFVIVRDGIIPDKILKHAAHFNIPIINIETKYYVEHEAESLMELIDSVDENTSYEDICLVTDRLSNSFISNCVNWKIMKQSIGIIEPMALKNKEADYYVSPIFASTLGEEELHRLNEKIASFLQYQIEKHVEHINTILSDTTKAIISSTQNGELYLPKENGISNVEVRSFGEKDARGTHNGDTMNEIIINIRGIGETIVEDGDHPSTLENYAKPDWYTSKYYNSLRPIVDAYLSALRENEEHIKRI